MNMQIVNDKGYTKHYFEENKRVCSNIGGGFRYAGYDIMDSIELITPFLEQWRNAKDGIFKTFEQCIKSPVDLENTQEKIVKVMKNHEKNRNEEEYQFYYTNDHLGSSTYITNKEGQITQTLAYLPYGEDWIDLDNQPPYITPYKFNGKEKDEETGYNNFGARYYYDWASIWLSVDPMSDKYPNESNYVYCSNNPVKYIDPNGKEKVDAQNPKDKKYATTSQAIRNYTRNIGVIHLWAHGNKDKIQTYNKNKNQDEYLKRPDEVKDFLSQNSAIYRRNNQEGEQSKTSILVLHSCKTGESDGIAQSISENLNLLVVAPTDILTQTSYKDGSNPKESINNDGAWAIYYKGKEMERFSGESKPLFDNPNKTIEKYEKMYQEKYGNQTTEEN